MLGFSQIEAVSEALYRAGTSTENLSRPRISRSLVGELNRDFYWNSIFFLVAICHDTRQVSGSIGGELLKGWDYLLRRWIQLMRESPDEIALDRLTSLDCDTLGAWFSDTREPSGSTLNRREERAYLLRDAACRLKTDWNGRIYSIYEYNDGWLSGEGGRGIVPAIHEFVAYSDPLHKKTWLLLDILSEDIEWRIRDPHQMGLTVDYHLERLALRTGMVKTPPQWAARLSQRQKIALADDVDLRRAVERAGKLICMRLSIPPGKLDRLLWPIARECCLRTDPVCITGDPHPVTDIASRYSLVLREPCPFIENCPGAVDPAYTKILEANVDTFYY